MALSCLVRIPRHASDKLTVNKDCIAPAGCHDGVFPLQKRLLLILKLV